MAECTAIRYDEGKPDLSMLPYDELAKMQWFDHAGFDAIMAWRNNRDSLICIRRVFDARLPFHIHNMLRVYDFGASRYGVANWRQGMKWSRIVSPALRHLGKWGIDEESGCPHYAHFLVNCYFLMNYSYNKLGEDNLQQFVGKRP